MLRPGLFARVTLVLNERENALQVPEQALVPQGQDQFVFKVEDGKAAFTKVKVGIRREGMVEITDGLGPEDEVVTAGQLKIRDGAEVKPVPPAEASELMFLPELSIRRPVLATVMSLIVVLVGIIAYDRLTVREYPKIDEPVVTVETTFKGASADIVESQVTQILEELLAGIEGIDYMSSISRPEKSQITARFRLDREPDAAANDVRDRVARVRGRLPDEIDEPIVSKVEADAQPIIYLAFSSDRHSPMDVTDFADRFVKDRLQNLAGVADVRVFGERRYSMRIWLDRARLAAYRLTPADVESALRHQNVEISGGPDRKRGARVHRRHRDRPAQRPAVREHRAARGERLSDPARLRRPRRVRARERARQRALQRPQRGGARRGQAGDRQPARRLRGGARRAAGDRAGSARGHADRPRLRFLDLHPRSINACSPPSARR